MDLDRLLEGVHAGDPRCVARAISRVEDGVASAGAIMEGLDRKRLDSALVVGITGPPGAGKSTLTGRLAACFRRQDHRVGIVAVDPSSPVTGGALLGDRIRMMEQGPDSGILVRSMASRGKAGGICAAAGAAVRIMAAAGCRIVLVETVGVGQAEWDVVRLADVTLLVLAPGFGDHIQAMKAGILEVVDLVVVNKADLAESAKLLLDLRAGAGENTVILETSAVRDQGIEELGQRILLLERELRQDNRLVDVRRQAREAETLEWLLELLRIPLARLVRKETEKGRDPRIAAERLLEKIGSCT